MPTKPAARFALSAAAGVLCSGTALAQVAPAALAECAAIAVDADRLDCFDRLSGRSAPVAPVSGIGTGSGADTGAAPSAPAEPLDAAAAKAAAVPAVGGSGTMIERAWGFEPTSRRYDISLYNPNYILAASHTTRLNTAPFDPLVGGGGVLKPGTVLDDTEAQFQVSFKIRAWTTDDRRWGAWVAYTQQSHWQLYNDSGNASRPFRETNYMPELILSHKPGLRLGDWQWSLFNLAFNHQSNGRSDTISRSWNRFIASFGVENGNFALMGRAWWRIPESAHKDDNPTISRYYGWGDVSAIYKWRDNSFAATLRGNPRTGRGAGQITWTSAPLLGALRGYVKVFSGYGESLIDYNWNQTTFGIGITLNDWL